MRDDLRGMTTEELQALRDQLKARPKAKPTPARLHPNATTADVLRVMSQADAILTELRTILWQWQANLDQLGAERLAQQNGRSQAV